ncbi:threonine dehydratase [Cenarchaeum symbiosum A]|uniref:threonine ammonia-lyase n=1 Tax=Cenarchaeum symbiosum (strain A) TaxID=414004 RepID=A0RVV9_CENSY|nr:threonine dehydratase [Cenarchaeum symbiosum A]
MRGAEVRKTPLVYSPTFSRMTGSEVYLKLEHRQKTGSFKIRGAHYKIMTLPDNEKKKGVVAASAGNHAQGVAFAASAEGIPCTIVMPKTASPAKVAATRGYGANVILEGSSYEESWNKAREIAAETGACIIHAFDDPQVIAAQGVIGLEILEELPDVDEVYIPVGGGGLAAGVLVAIKEKHPGVRVVGVQSSRFPAMKESLDRGSTAPSGGGTTIADGISVRSPGELTFAIIRELIDEIVLVDDSEIIGAMFLLMERSKSVVEPSGAATLAHILSNPRPGKKVVAVLAGGNVDMYLLGQIVDKGLAQTGRLLKVFILLPDKPGALKEVVDEITSANANIVEVVHDRFSSEINAGSAGVTLSLETQGAGAADGLVRHLRDRGIIFRLVT